MIYKSLLILIVILNSSSLFASNLEPCGITSKIEGKSCKDLRVEFDLTSCEPELAKALGTRINPEPSPQIEEMEAEQNQEQQRKAGR